MKSWIAERLPPKLYSHLLLAGTIGDRSGWKIYAAGGMVRDLLLNIINSDLDLVVGGDGLAFADILAGKLNGKVVKHAGFQTAVITLPDGTRIDVVTARKERYSHPAALPLVEAGTLRDDLNRRDFTINAMAVQLNQASFGLLIDYCGGNTDLKGRVIRVLYDRSFIEDPTRLLRAIRFEQRYGFSMEPQTLGLARTSAALAALEQVSGSRIWGELAPLLAEDHQLASLQRMDELGLWERVLPGLDAARNWRAVERAGRVIEDWAARSGEKPRCEIIYLAAILFGSGEAKAGDLARHFNLPRQDSKMIQRAAGDCLVSALKGLAGPAPGRLHRLLRGEAVETVLVLAARQNSGPFTRQIVNYLARRESMPSLLTGADLLSLGMKPGPIFAMILQQVECAYLDGRVSGREQALNLAGELFKGKENEPCLLDLP